MMKPLHVIAAVVFAAVALFYGGCTDTAPSGPVTGLGGVTINKYVGIGDSFAAGYESNALFESAQKYGYVYSIARQLKAAGANLGTFEIPTYSDPGNPDPKTGKAARYDIVAWTYSAAQNKYVPTVSPAGLAPGAPTNTTLARPYDNLGIPGAVIYDFLDTASFASKAGPPRNNPFFQLVLRNPALGKNILQQAAALNPDLVSFWLGGNDVLGFATSGGVSPSSPTSAAIFNALYPASLAQLRAALPNAKIVVANVANVDGMPFFTTVGPMVAASLAAKSAQLGVTLYLRYQMHGNSSVAFDSTKLTEANPPMILLTGSSFASLIGTPTGAWYRINGYPALPPGIDTTKPFGLHPQNPWPDALVLDAGEQATVQAAVDAFNATIANAAAASQAYLVDITGFWEKLQHEGIVIGGQKFSTAYISGGFFSLDGVHPSSRGYALIGNEFLKVINTKLGTGIPFADVASVPGVPSGPMKVQGQTGIPEIPYDAFADFSWLFGGSQY